VHDNAPGYVFLQWKESRELNAREIGMFLSFKEIFEIGESNLDPTPY
jgi:hypothetical protein